MLCEAAHPAQRPNHPLHPYFARLCAQRGYKMVVVAVARGRRERPVLWVDVATTPDTGQIAPDVLLHTGTTIHVKGEAARERICIDQVGRIDSVTKTPQNGTWKMVFYPRGGLAQNKTSDLSAATTLTPTFVAKEAGTYRVTLTANANVPKPTARRVTLVIEAAGNEDWVSIGSDGRWPQWTAPGYAELCVTGAMPRSGLCGVRRATPARVLRG